MKKVASQEPLGENMSDLSFCGKVCNERVRGEMIKSSVFVTFLFLLPTQYAAAAGLWYIMSGELPNGASSHQFIEDGESYVARFLIDPTIPDYLEDDPTTGGYLGAAIEGEIRFSGGYYVEFDYQPLDVFVGNNLPEGTDSILIEGRLNPNPNRITIQANSTDLTYLSDDGLPVAALEFESEPDPFRESFGAFEIIDDFGVVYHDAGDANNVRFQVVPEPTSSLFLGLPCAFMGKRKRHRISPHKSR